MIQPRSRRGLLVLLVAVVLVGLAGCSGNTIQGTVTLDGAPVDGGAIRFVPAEQGSKAKAVGAEIKGGKYLVKGDHDKGVEPGSYRVEISWKKPTGKQIPTPGDASAMREETVEVIPALYNSKSDKKADIKGGSNTIDYAITSSK